MGPYDDIINLPHHISRRHPQMPPENRAAQFAPFAALTGYEDAIGETGRLTEAEVELTEDEISVLNEKLTALEAVLREQPRTEVQVTYFEPDLYKAGGEYRTITDTVRRIDHYRKCLVMESGDVIAMNRLKEIVWE